MACLKDAGEAEIAVLANQTARVGTVDFYGGVSCRFELGELAVGDC